MKASVEGSGTAVVHRPLDVSWIPSFHSNGEWYFALSKGYTLRILHIRTSAMVLEERLYISNGAPFPAPTTYSLEPVDDFEVMAAVVTPYNAEDQTASETAFWAVISTYRITLDPKLVTASIETLARIPLNVLPRLFDLAGDYAVIVEDDEDWGGFGEVHVVDWRTGEHANIPPVCPSQISESVSLHLPSRQLFDSFAISGFPDYFISLGVDPECNIELQVVSLPLQKKSPEKPTEGFDDKDSDDSENTKFVLAGSIPIQSDSKHVLLDYSDEFALICHHYTGRTINTIRAWIRGFSPENLPSYNVFTIKVDFSKPPEQWFTVLESLPFEGGSHPQAPQYHIEHKRLSEKDNVAQYVVPGSSGTRWFWWQGDTPDTDPDTASATSRRALRLYSADSESLPSLTKRPPPEEDLDDDATHTLRHERSTAYPVREMECPFSYDFPPPAYSDDSDDEDEEDRECVYSLVIDDWSGTALVTLTCGDILVLRYGHP
jgi:hypothetical protein